LAQAKNIDIGVESERDISVLMHEIDLLAVIRNLVDNAIRYTPSHGQIDLSVVTVEGRARVQVSDSGPGIAQEEWPRIFDPFYRTLGSTETGSGLGLAIVKAIADRNGAQIQLGFKDDVLPQRFYVCVFIPCPSIGECTREPPTSDITR
jgi:two-component system OmpR family sensor kinase